MPLENRDLGAGTVLVARHKKQEFTCEVVETPDGLRYRLQDGSEHKSPSSAGRVVTNGVAVNGWRFWSLQGDLKPAKATKEPKAKAPTKAPAKKKTAKKAKSAKKSKGKAQKAASRASYGCGVCSEEFPTLKAATKHATEAHLS
jgi:hypothetical protein